MAFQRTDQVGRKLLNFLFLISIIILLIFHHPQIFLLLAQFCHPQLTALSHTSLIRKYLWVPSFRLEMPTMCPESRLSHDIIKMDPEDRNLCDPCVPHMWSRVPFSTTRRTHGHCYNLTLTQALIFTCHLGEEQEEEEDISGIFYLKKISNLTKS